MCGREEGGVAHQQHTTNKRTTYNTEHAKWHRQFCVPKKSPTWSSHLVPEVHKRNPWILHIFSLRIDRKQHVPDSSNLPLYLRKLFSFRNLEGSSGGNRQPDGSITLSPSPTQQHATSNLQRQRRRERETKPKFHERFARQTISMMFGN